MTTFTKIKAEDPAVNTPSDAENDAEIDTRRRHSSPSPSPQPAFAEASAGSGGGESCGAGGSIDWEEVRRAYELSGESVAEIQQRFGLTASQLTKRRVAEDWTPRPQIAKPGPLQGHKLVGIEALELRLNRLVAIGTAMLEKNLAENGMTEANARTLTELCRAEELRMRSTLKKTAKSRETKNNDAGYDFRDDPEWLDAELKRRLALLIEDRDANCADRQEGPEGAAGISR